MDEKGIKYQDLDVAVDKAAREEMIRKSGQMTVPTIEIDGELMVGFDEAKLREKLGLS